MKTTLRGTCPVCYKRKRVTMEGYIYDHDNGGQGYYCPGSWKRPHGTQATFDALEERQRTERRVLAQELCV